MTTNKVVGWKARGSRENQYGCLFFFFFWTFESKENRKNNIERIPFLAIDKQHQRVILAPSGAAGQIKCKITSKAGAGCSYHLWPSSNYHCSWDRYQRWSLSTAEDQQTKRPTMGQWLFRRGTATSWRVQSAWFSRRAPCIMHDGCYFHHMVPSGVIVVAAPSAQIALCSQIVVWASTLTLSPHFLPLPSPHFPPLPHGNGFRGPTGLH